MRIAWFTPYSARSAIGRYSRIVTTELAHTHEVEIWTFCRHDLLPSAVRIHSLASHAEVPGSIRDFDAVVYQMGNYWPFHGEIWRQSRRHPGVIVLHDFVMHGFFAEYFFEVLRQPTAYADAMRQWHGDAGAEAAADLVSRQRRPIWEGEDVMKYPMVQGVTDGALGVISHSKFVVDAAGRHYFGPKKVLALPYENSSAPVSLSRSDLKVGDDELLIVTVGHVNPNKRIDETISAIGGLPEALKRRIVYAVLGPVEERYGASLMRLAGEAGVAAGMRLTGYATNELMHGYLTHADVCVNLRHPNTEGASASLIEQLLAGKAVITNETGWFAELPSDVTWRVGLNNTVQLQEGLRLLLEDTDTRSRMAHRAYEYATSTFRADLYANGVHEFLNSVLRLVPVNSLADSIAARMHSMAIDPAGSWALSVAERAGSLLREAAGSLGGHTPESGSSHGNPSTPASRSA